MLNETYSPGTTTLRAKALVATQGLYSNIVFMNLDEPENSLKRYITVTLLPNWQTQCPEFGVEGYLTIDTVRAGDTYFNMRTQKEESYRYEGSYFRQFVPIKQTTNSTTTYNF